MKITIPSLTAELHITNTWRFHAIAPRRAMIHSYWALLEKYKFWEELTNPNFIYLLQVLQCFHIFLRPFDNYIIFFLQFPLSFQSSSINPFSPISPLILSAQLILVLPGGRHFVTSFGNLPSSILWTCPHHLSFLVLISTKTDLTTLIFCLIIVFLILSFLKIRAERRQKSISVEFSCATVFTFKHHVSATYVIVLLILYREIKKKVSRTRPYRIIL